MNDVKKKKENCVAVWCRKHKKGLVVAGGCILVFGAGVGVRLYCRSSDVHFQVPTTKPPVLPPPKPQVPLELPKLSDQPPKLIEKKYEIRDPWMVQSFVRDLPNNQHPSPEKVIEAAELGIALKEHQTLVDSHLRGGQK